MQKPIYEERLYSPWNLIIIGAVGLVLLAALVWQLLFGPLGTRPAPSWFLAAIAALFLALWINFSALTVRVTMDGLCVGYGIIRHRIRWHDICDCRPDESSMAAYGGWGIRIGRVGGKTRLGFTTPGVPRVVVEKRQGRCLEFAFSTRNPEAVMRAIRQGLGKT